MPPLSESVEVLRVLPKLENFDSDSFFFSSLLSVWHCLTLWHMLRVGAGDQSAFLSMPAPSSPPRSGQFLDFCRCRIRTQPEGLKFGVVYHSATLAFSFTGRRSIYHLNECGFVAAGQVAALPVVRCGAVFCRQLGRRDTGSD